MIFTGLPRESERVSDVFLLSERQMERIEPFFPLAHEVPRVDERDRLCDP
ncbi:hypothetical protein ATR01nite_18180 [Acetobacter tropicalis]|uniref:Transposase n=1 Tax=Acetobacter tropicalis TaxID=104102 RepID=A0A511FP74_9PROT|nr:hypothetical protein ATR01nite_18180 [Acetobacter tropicalis]